LHKYYLFKKETDLPLPLLPHGSPDEVGVGAIKRLLSAKQYHSQGKVGGGSGIAVRLATPFLLMVFPTFA
jgi:hypothetical protein